MTTRGWAWGAACALGLAVVAFDTDAEAHPSPGSTAFVDFGVDGARIEQDVPISELEAATHGALIDAGETAAQAVARRETLLRGYVSEHVRLFSEGGVLPWRAEGLSLDGVDAEDGPRLRFTADFRAPPGQAYRSVIVRDDVVAREVITHYLSVYVRTDWASGARPSAEPSRSEPRLAGVVHAGRIDLVVARDGSFFRGLRSVVAQGTQHILTGTDHLVFLFALLLVAPVAVRAGRWREPREIRASVASLLRVITAFTIAHSLTLALGALGLASIPERLVEAAIALSVLITAIHAARPVFPRHEPLVAGLFGLVHGLAFAGGLVGRDLGRAQAAWSLVAFNVGIELAQLALVSLVTPWLFLMARTRVYPAFRTGAAGLAAILAMGWWAELVTHRSAPTSVLVAWLERHPLLLLVAFAASAIVASRMDRRSRWRKRPSGEGLFSAGEPRAPAPADEGA